MPTSVYSSLTGVVILAATVVRKSQMNRLVVGLPDAETIL